MSLVGEIKSKAGRHYLQKALQENKRVSKLKNYETARSVGILYKAGDKAHETLVKNYVQYLKAEHGIRDIMALGYFETKELPEAYHIKLSFEYFTKKELNWHLRPESTSVLKFIEHPYDLLIDFSDKDSVPLRFVLALSKAKFKVGKQCATCEPFYDFMISTKEDQSTELYIETVNHYLGLLTSTNER